VSPDPLGMNDWLRRKSKVKVKVGSSTFALPTGVHVSDVTDDALHADPAEVAEADGADGGAGRDQEQQARSLDMDGVIRQGVALRKLRKMGRL
jgi:hypothetical protein